MSKINTFPVQVGMRDFKKRKIQKVVSGANHTIVLSDRKLYAWGDPDTCVLGRMPVKRRRYLHALRVGGLGYKNVLDVFTGENHCFLLCARFSKKENVTHNCVYGWGLNNWGQLGIGEHSNTIKAVEVEMMRDKGVVQIVGGRFHTLFLTKSGDIYGCGRNEDNQLGPIDLNVVEELDLRKNEGQYALKKKYPAGANLPVKLLLDQKFKKVFAASDYSYAVQEDNTLRTWGMGNSYVLGNGNEDEVIQPHTISTENFLKNKKIGMLSLGANHVLFSTSNKYWKSSQMDNEVRAIINKRKEKIKRKQKKKEMEVEVVKTKIYKVKIETPTKNGDSGKRTNENCLNGKSLKKGKPNN